MSQDTFTEVTRRSWGSRLGGAFKGILVGLVLIVVGLFVLFKNEGRAVRRARALDHGSSAVVSVGADRIDPANEGALVHVSGMVETDDILTDPQFGISARALHLRRNVEMYQWHERSSSTTEKKVGGSTETTTTYSYEKDWSERAIGSSGFKKPEGHRNPGAIPFENRIASASSASLGAFQLSPSLIGRMSTWTPVAVSGTSLLPETMRGRASLTSGGFYLGDDPSNPQVGDLRVTFEIVKPGLASIVARQGGASLGPWQARNGQTVELLRTGSVPAEAMFESAHSSNQLTTWILRLFGFVLILWGLRAILRPLSVMADVLPALGNLAEGGIRMFTLFLAGFMAFSTIGFAWLWYRPLLGLGVLLMAFGALLGVVTMVKRSRAAVRSAPAAPATEPQGDAHPKPPPPPPPPAG